MTFLISSCQSFWLFDTSTSHHNLKSCLPSWLLPWFMILGRLASLSTLNSSPACLRAWLWRPQEREILDGVSHGWPTKRAQGIVRIKDIHPSCSKVWMVLWQSPKESESDRGDPRERTSTRGIRALSGREDWRLKGQEGGLYLPESPWQALPLIESPKEEDLGSAAPLPAMKNLREWWSLPGGNTGESHVRREHLGWGSWRGGAAIWGSLHGELHGGPRWE